MRLRRLISGITRRIVQRLGRWIVRGWLRRIVQRVPPGVGAFGFWATTTFLLPSVTKNNAPADTIVPERRR